MCVTMNYKHWILHAYYITLNITRVGMFLNSLRPQIVPRSIVCKELCSARRYWKANPLPLSCHCHKYNCHNITSLHFYNSHYMTPLPVDSIRTGITQLCYSSIKCHQCLHERYAGSTASYNCHYDVTAIPTIATITSLPFLHEVRKRL